MARMRVIQRCLQLLLALILLTGSMLGTGAFAWAQTFPERAGAVVDDTGNLDAGAVNDAALELEAQGAAPLAVMLENRTGSDDDRFARLVAEEYGYGSVSDEFVEPNLFAIVVTLNPRRIILLWGDQWNSVMADAPDGKGLAAQIRTRYMQPNLASGDYTEAFVESFRYAAEQINLDRNPPTPAPTSTPRPTVVTNIDTGGLGDALMWIAGVVVLVGALAVIGPRLWGAYKRNQESTEKRRALKEQLTQARNVTADMITDLEFPADPAEQLQYRFLALAIGNERPAELSRLQAEYRTMYDRVSAALSRYNDANTANYNTEEELKAGIAQYQGIQSEINAAATFLKDIGERSRQVEGQIAAAPGETEAAKKALAAATNSLGRLAAAAPELHRPDPSAVVKTSAALLERADTALASSPPLHLTAYDAAVQARSSAEQVGATIDRVLTSYAGLSELRGRVADYRKRGYKLVTSDEHDASLVALMSRGMKALETDSDPALIENVLRSVGEGLGQARSRADELVQRQRANEQELAALEKAGSEIEAYIAQGAQTFDQVDNYAESSWADIRGNGTEAQRAANRAQELWAEASSLNALDSGNSQDFDRAAELVAEAHTLLSKARDLITAIIDRLKNIEESNRIAAAEIEAARRDIATGRAFVARFNKEISPSPESLLDEADRILADARAEAAKKPADWIAIVREARRANDMADKALAEARSQQEAMQATRLKIATTGQQAVASLSRAFNFTNVHRSDIEPALFRDIEQLQTNLQSVQTQIAKVSSSGLEDVALRTQLDDLAGRFTALQANADRIYGQAEQQFRAMEELRDRAYGTLKNVSMAIEQTTFYMNMHQGVVSLAARRLLTDALNALPQVGDYATADELNAAIQGAAVAADLVQKASRRAQRDVREYEQDVQAEEEARRAETFDEDFWGGLIGGVIGSAIGGGGRGGGGGGGWDWGGGGSRGGGGGGWSWGGGGGSRGGSSGGGWGGGRSSSGGFGGGGSSGGGWGKGGSSSGGW